MLRDAKKQYKDKLANDLINSNNNSKRWYKLVSQIINPQSNEQSIPFLETDEHIIESNYEITEPVNNFFIKQSAVDDTNVPLPEFHPPNYDALENNLITEDDVKEAISLLKQNKAPGPDLISPRLYKGGAEQLIPYLRKLFNFSLAVRQFPPSWKRSNLTAVHKKDSRSNPIKYRRY